MKVSCLCVSHGRPAQLEQAIALFDRQSYPCRELVILLDQADAASISVVSASNVAGINLVLVDSSRLRLGQLRNRSLDAATGDVICNWDDDDWHHPRRVEEQVAALQYSGKPATALQRILMYDRKLNNSYLSMVRLWENTIVCEIELIRKHGIKYSPRHRGEDYPFVESVKRHGGVYPLLKPWLYIYNRTGFNTFGNDHFAMLFRGSQTLQESQTSVVSKAVEGRTAIDAAGQELEGREFLSALEY